MNKFLLSILFLVIVLGCTQSIYHFFSVPTYVPKPVYNFGENKSDQDKIELGRMLFYDPILSRDSTISCASCHSPYNAFAHTDHDVSHGIDNQLGTRNAPALFNLAWQKNFMWDYAINNLDVQALAPITHPKEMGENLPNVLKKLNRSKIYKPYFEKIFKTQEITSAQLLQTLAQFQVSIVSFKSKYDSVKLGLKKFTNQEENGYAIFKKNCNVCHTEPLFSNYQLEKNALPIDKKYLDFGRMMITKNPADSLLFKVPSLRNLSYTFPYMHDGRMKKISEVINHYANNIPENYSEKLKGKIVLTSNEKQDLKAFLLTLNDETIFQEKKYLDPKNISRRKK